MIELNTIWQDKDGYKVQVIHSDENSVCVIKETNFKYCGGKKGFFKYDEFTPSFFLHIFTPVL